VYARFELPVLAICLSAIPHMFSASPFDRIWLKTVFGKVDRLCGLVVRVLGYRSGGPGSIHGTTRKKNVVSMERGSFSLVSTTEELLDRKVAAPVYKIENTAGGDPSR
jgi:hypothetical protein